MMDQIKAEIAPTGVLRAGINMGNFLLVTSRAENGDPAGVSPSMARAIADTLGRLGADLTLIGRDREVWTADEHGA